MCEFCENGKNLSVTGGVMKIERDKYSPSGYRLVTIMAEKSMEDF